jgi:hypothetical protein
MDGRMMYVTLTLAYLGWAVAASAQQQGGALERGTGSCLCGRDVNAADACFESRQCADAEPCNVNTDCNPTPGGYCIPNTVSGCPPTAFVGTCARQTAGCPDASHPSCDLQATPQFPLPDCVIGGPGGTDVPALDSRGIVGLGLMLAAAGAARLRRRRTSRRP